ncbi:MAG: 50S ribosomal protein L9 [Acidobacteria bacterium]|jgi:large subunit ribosomal protein L9|nr:50S ribosomal protein L9 [Thermoanaerobaculia bacterium]MDI9631320.1 50S ribosomal protein L9 [Acidobacteriota bacterium]OQC42355.1 MAG: 50S ribosomal protein L9 [Acidobacteria bacterium ADurb.Bin051]MBP7812002.1 50S ribosomal protein L9 [Thermoanaerobaculia bacterium]MBP8844752.1 50S ribosomal protein L9 [Thermoanaerobaculia bacterium]
MKVILLSDLRHQGRRGEVIEVRPGFARNYLLPQGLAMLATPGNMKRFEQERKKIDLRHAAERAVAAELAARLAGVKITIAKRATEANTLYGSVTASEIADALAEKGIEIDRRRIDLAGGIKTLGDHVVRVDLHSEVIAELAVDVVAAS